MFRSIRWRLLATYLVVILLALSFLGVHLARDSEARYLAQVEASLVAQARLIADHVREEVAAGEPGRTQAELQRARFQEGLKVILVDRTGAVLARFPGEPPSRLGAHVGREGLPLALGGQEASGSSRTGDLQIVYGAVPVRTGSEVLGAVYLEMPLVALAEQIRHIRVFVGWTVLATLLWAALVGLLLAQRIAGPIQEMRTATARLAAGDLGQRVRIRTADELGDLARALNYMAAELERLDAMRREFVADASHELRTPVANLAVAVEALRAAGPEDAASAPLLDAVEREVVRLHTLVDRLLDLSAIESGRVQLHLEPTDIGQLVGRVVGSFRGRAAQAGIALGQEGPARGLTAHVDPDRMGQVLSNLLDNALKFTPSGGRVTVSVVEQRGRVAIHVDDTGPGIPEQDLPHIFDRFFKSDRARTGQPGAGLGLAIARRLLAAQGGTITAHNRPGGGARFVVKVPG